MYKGEMYANVRRACLAEGMSGRETSQVFDLHREVVQKMLAHQGSARLPAPGPTAAPPA